MNSRFSQITARFLIALLLMQYLTVPVHAVSLKDKIRTIEQEAEIEDEDLPEEVNQEIEEEEEKSDSEEQQKSSQEEPSPEELAFFTAQDPINPLDFLQGFQGNFQTDLFTGAATYNYPLWAPQGRSGMNPSLSLSYSSSNKDKGSLTAYGWNLTNNYILRTSDKGVDKLYTENNFAASIMGSYTELILTQQSPQIYGAQAESDFKQYQFVDNHWLVRDKSGTEYSFGLSANSRSFDPDDSSRVYKWMLERVEDTNGNYMTFTYTKDSGQIYPSSIRYSGHGSNQGLYEIRFSKTLKENSFTSYQSAFAVKTRYIINQIDIYSYQNSVPAKIRSYQLNYENRGTIDLLQSIAVKGGSLSYPPVEFDYQLDSLLQAIRLPAGALLNFSYQKSTAYRTSNRQIANKGLPFSIETLRTYGFQASASSPIDTYQYDYSGGHYYFDYLDVYKKEYAGFHEVEVTDPQGNVEKIYFHQSELSADNSASSLKGEYQDHISKKGRIYRQETYDNSGKLFELSISKWDKSALPDADSERERDFVFLTRQVQLSYDGDSDYRATASDYDYDEYGNLIEQRDYGEVLLSNSAGDFTDLGADKLITKSFYLSNESNYIHGLPYQSQLFDSAGNKLNEQQIYYDDLALQQATKGNATKRSIWLEDDGTYLSSKIVYNSYGLPTEITNSRGFTTTVTYDDFALFPSAVQNALGHSNSYQYDYRFGQVATVTDPNGAKTITEYDDLGRTNKLKLSNPDNPSATLLQGQYSYDTTHYPNSISQTTYTHNDDVSGQPIELISKTYFDGLGRQIQSRVETEKVGSSDRYLVSGKTYNSLGQVDREYLPILRNTINYESNYATSDTANSYTYDALGRTIQTQNILGTSRVNYDQWSQTVTDMNGQKKDFHFDARQNLTKVTEYLNGNKYDTVYAYDNLNNLVKITDAKGNIREMTYDNLGRIMTMTDLHKSGANAYGIYSYAYDANGNRIQMQTPAGDEINYIYDELDRLVSEDWAGSSGIDVKYAYDLGPNSIGRLTWVSSADYHYGNDGDSQGEAYTVNKIYRYDKLGRVISERLINGGSGFDYQASTGLGFLTSFDLDFLGNIEKITYPNENEVTYQYNNAALIEKISLKKPNNSDIHPIISNFDYSPTLAIARVEYGNGVVTENVYDPTELYRLTDKVTSKGSTKYQDIDYAFDAVGNIEELSDHSSTVAAKRVLYAYDDLYRLTQVLSTSSQADYIRSYQYDIIGNMTNRSDQGIYQYQGINPHAVSNVAGEAWTYDDNGNLTSAGSWTYDWDYRNRLIRARDGSDHDIIYLYDESGNRVAKKDLLTNEAGKYINKYYESEGMEGRSMIYAGSMKVATEIDYAYVSLNNPSLQVARTVYHHPDHLSGTSVDTDENGNILEVIDYYPYGDLHLSENYSEDLASYDNTSYEANYKFTGKEMDEGTGLYYYGARYYDSRVGRFISQDPWFGDLSDPQSLNKYAYVRNNPLKYVDPSGEWFIDWLIGNVYAPANEDQSGNINELKEAAEGATKSDNPIAIGLEVSPGIGDANDIYGTITGQSAITGEELSTTDRLLSGAASVLPIVTGSILRKAIDETVDIVDEVINSVTKNIDGGKLEVDEILDNAENWLGEEYEEIANGVYRSKTNPNNQYRMTDSDINHTEPHVHFEYVDDNGKNIIENSHVKIKE